MRHQAGCGATALPWQRPRRVVALWALACGATAFLLAACAPADGDRAATGIYRLAGSPRNPAIEQMEHGSEYGVVAASRAMVHAPQALLVLERRLGAAVEQRIVLPNATAVRGDNVLHVRAQTAISARGEEFNFADVAARFGGLPAPFERTAPGGLLSGSDAMGSYVYARENLGVDTVCVLVLRRIGAGARPLPRGTQSLDVVMRNCVVGTLDQALAPMSDRAMAVAAAPQGAVYTMSPFAAPQR